MNSILTGDLIAIAIISLIIFVAFVVILTLIHDPVKDKYKYCHDCPYGLCTSDPKTKDCWKWRDEQWDKTHTVTTSWFHSLDVQAEVEKIAEKKH